MTLLRKTERTYDRLLGCEQNIQRVWPNDHIVVQHGEIISLLFESYLARIIPRLSNCDPLPHHQGLDLVSTLFLHVANVAPHFDVTEVRCRLDTAINRHHEENPWNQDNS